MGHGLPGSNAENVEYLLFFNMISTEGNKLVQHGLCIPHTIRHFGDSKALLPCSDLLPLQKQYGAGVLQ